jgi:DNA helicase-2/ATP-dependent DNA helicase PcrA
MTTPGDSANIELNKPQQEAVDHSGSPLLVLAGPGTGKTRVIIARLLRLLRDGADPSSLLAVTFSVKATNEMRERLALWAAPGGTELEDAASRVQVSTFHGLGRRITRRFADVLGVHPEPTLLDAAVAKRALRPLIEEMGLFRAFAGEGFASAIAEHLDFEAACKHNAKSPEDALAYAQGWRQRLAAGEHGLAGDGLKAQRLAQSLFEDHARLYDAFDRLCIRRGLLTFDDYLAYPLRIFRAKPDLASFLRAEFQHIVVDELQDVNPAQLELMRWIAPPGSDTDLCAVGDDDQAIYAFRGSDPAAVSAFKRDWPGHHTVTLSDNHRSAPNVVRVGNAVIERARTRVAPDKKIIAAGKHDSAGSVEAYTVPKDSDHGTLIGALILADRAANLGRKWSDYAVLVRGKSQLEQCAVALKLRGIPVDTRERPTPADDPGVQDLLAWIGLLVDPKDDRATQRLLVRPSFGVPVEKVRAWRESHGTARRAHASERGDDAGGDAPWPGLADWITANHADVPEVSRFGALLSELRRAATTMTADDAVEHIVREAHLVGDDGPERFDPAQRSARARALVAALRFARARQAFLDHPADLGAFLAYYNDLDDDGKNFRSPSSDDVDPGTGSDGDERPDAVSVITAHRAKGLEWDTVFVVKVSPGQGGFSIGKREEPGDHDLPADFTQRDASADADEELRLFYVACTRARRRLILTAKGKKAPKPKDVPGADLFQFLTHFRPDLGVAVVPMEDVLRAAGTQAPSELETELASTRSRTAGADRTELVRRETVRARQAAFAALHDAAAPGVNGDSMRAIEARLADAAHAIAALSRLGGTSAVPPTSLLSEVGAAGAPGSVAGPLLRRVTELQAQLAKPSHVHPWPAPAMPLRLSYTQVRSYIDCPRCWYLRYVLGLEDRGSAEANIGNVAHAALEGFYRRIRDAEAEGGRPPAPNDLHRLADAAFDRQFPVLSTDAEAQRKMLHAQLSGMLERLHPTTHQVLELELPITMPFVDSMGTKHTLFAKIDRLDLDSEGNHRVIDYKTGQAWKSLLEPKADDLQLGIYAMALAHHVGSDHPPQGNAEYWVLASGQRGVIALSDLKLDKVRQVIDDAVLGMRKPPYERSAKCSGHCLLMG